MISKTAILVDKDQEVEIIDLPNGRKMYVFSNSLMLANFGRPEAWGPWEIYNSMHNPRLGMGHNGMMRRVDQLLEIFNGETEEELGK
jgi:hypothetical protein